MAILPRRPRSCGAISDRHCRDPSLERFSIRAIAIADQISGHRIPWESLRKLARYRLLKVRVFLDRPMGAEQCDGEKRSANRIERKETKGPGCVPDKIEGKAHRQGA